MKSHTIKLTLLAAIFLLGSVVISQSDLFSRARLDLTENKLFTLNQGTKNILQNIDERIHIKLYFSNDATRNIPVLRTYKNTVLDLLNEMKRYSDAKLEVTLIDPKIFSPEEDEASQFGLQALPVGDSRENIFFGIIGQNMLDGLEIIPFMQPERESFLEYDLVQLINSLNNPYKKRVGIMSSIDIGSRVDKITGKTLPAQFFLTQLNKDYLVEMIDTSTEIIDDIDVLLLIHPKNLSDKSLFAIDQFVMNGGRLMVFVDPLAQAEIIIPDPQNPMAVYQADKNSNLEKLFAAWNVKFDAKQVVLDNKFALNIQARQGRQERPIRHLAFLALQGSAFNNKDIVVREVGAINLATTGYFESENMQSIINSSEDSSNVSSSALKFLSDPNKLFKTFQPSGKQHMISGRITGSIKTAFPEVPGAVLENTKPRIILFADVDVLFDQMWIRSQKIYGKTVFSAFADNGYLITNLLDNMSGSDDLINIRGRKNSARPFTKVIEIQKASDNKFREQENVLKQRLIETEEKLKSIQKEKGPQNRMILSQEQEQELQKFQNEKLEVRKKLREVRRSLDKDIQDLGSQLKMINIGLIPALVSLLGIFILWIRPKMKGSHYAK